MFPVNERIKKCKRNWIKYIDRIKESRIPKIAKDYNPRGKTNTTFLIKVI